MKKITLKKVFLSIGLVVMFFVVMKRCSFHTLPKEKLKSVKVEIEEKYDNGYELFVKNPMYCPMRFYFDSDDVNVEELLGEKEALTIEANSDTTFYIKDKGDLSGKIKFGVKWGDPELPIRSTTLQKLPYPEGRSYELLQGNNSNPTHNSEMSRYAFDFTMGIGDTITSTHDGYVVSLVDGYKGWGMSDRWKSYGNEVMIYDTTSHLFTLYGHLKQDGGLVAVGDFVRIGQPIALSGKTGQTTEEHLHFNVLQPDNSASGLSSYRLDSIGSYKVEELRRRQRMKS